MLGTSLDEHTGIPEALSSTLVSRLGVFSLMKTAILQLQHLHILIVMLFVLHHSKNVQLLLPFSIWQPWSTGSTSVSDSPQTELTDLSQSAGIWFSISSTLF